MVVELPEQLSVDIDTFTLGEIEDIEDLTGKSWTAVLRAVAAQETTGRIQRALIFIALRREVPSVTFDALKDLTVMQVADALRGPQGDVQAGGDAVDPSSSPSGAGAP